MTTKKVYIPMEIFEPKGTRFNSRPKKLNLQRFSLSFRYLIRFQAPLNSGTI